MFFAENPKPGSVRFRTARETFVSTPIPKLESMPKVNM
jgi:hypothetical protein